MVYEERRYYWFNSGKIKDKYALPTLPKFLTAVQIPAETKLRIGEADPLSGWGNGGGHN